MISVIFLAWKLDNAIAENNNEITQNVALGDGGELSSFPPLLKLGDAY